MKTSVLIIAFVFAAAPSWAQKPKVPDTHHADTSIHLTTEEAKDVENLQLRKQILDLQAARVNDQIEKAKATLQQEDSALAQRLIKAHDIDPAKFRFDAEKKAFVPIPEKKKP